MNKSYIKHLRLIKNISQRKLAEASGLSGRSIWRLEHGDPKTVERIKQIVRLCFILDCSVEDLVELDEESESLRKNSSLEDPLLAVEFQNVWAMKEESPS